MQKNYFKTSIRNNSVYKSMLEIITYKTLSIRKGCALHKIVNNIINNVKNINGME